MIYLTDSKVACSHQATLVSDVLFPQYVHMLNGSYAGTATGMSYPPHKVAGHVLDKSIIDRIKSNPAEKTAFILAAGNSNFSGEHLTKRKGSSLSYVYKFAPLTLTQIWASKVAMLFGDMDMVTVDSSACASSLKVLMDAQTLIRHYGYGRVIVLTVEDQVNNATLEFFGESKASLPYMDGENTKKPSAFDTVNGQFHIGQGAALAVFESEAVAASSGSVPQAMLVSAYAASEKCSNPLSQLPSGEGFTKAMVGAMQLGQVTPSDISVVKTHGTGTASNNTAESAAITGLLTEFIATSFKPSIGHTMGASGLLESIMLMDSMRLNGTVPCIKNRTEHDAVFISEDTKPTSGLIMSLAAGMGNIYAAAIFSLEV